MLFWSKTLPKRSHQGRVSVWPCGDFFNHIQQIPPIPISHRNQGIARFIIMRRTRLRNVSARVKITAKARESSKVMRLVHVIIRPHSGQRRVFCCRLYQAHNAFFNRWQKGILLGFVKTMNFINKDKGVDFYKRLSASLKIRPISPTPSKTADSTSK